MKRKNWMIALGVSALLISSCCKEDQEYWFPEGAIRYYDQNDTITFYCPEDDEYLDYVVCIRDTLVEIYPNYGTFCDYTDYFYEKLYRVVQNNCNDSVQMTVIVNASFQKNIAVKYFEIDKQDTFRARYEDSPKHSVEVQGHTYSKVIKITGKGYTSLQTILFSYEYGVIQMQFENKTYSLLNNEI